MRQRGNGDTVSPSASAPAPQGASLLVRVRGLRPALSPAEDRVADQVLRDPRQASSWTISQLAAAADTSETTVLRFCRRLDLAGYPQLRLALAAESAQPRTLSASRTDISAKDSIDDIISKIAFHDASAVEETALQLDREVLADAARRVARASRVDIYGVAASGLVAADLQQKLHRIGCLSFAWSDSHLALTSAALLGRRDVAIAISHTGATKETIEAAAMAQERGATTIAITNFPLSPLARASDLVLTTAARETALRSGATASRIAALTVIDCLYIAVAHRNLPAARRAVKSTRVAVSRHHVQDED